MKRCVGPAIFRYPGRSGWRHAFFRGHRPHRGVLFDAVRLGHFQLTVTTSAAAAAAAAAATVSKLLTHAGDQRCQIFEHTYTLNLAQMALCELQYAVVDWASQGGSSHHSGLLVVGRQGTDSGKFFEVFGVL